MASRPLDLTQVQVTGPLDARIRLGLAHLLAARETILSYSGWGGDQYGRWLPAVALSYHYTGAQNGLPGQVLDRFLRTQLPSGMFGDAASPANLWWGAGRALIGLLEYWELTRETKALRGATRLADFYLTDFPLAEAQRRDQPGATHYQSGIEGLVALWRATGQQRYLTLAERIFQTMDPEFGQPLGQEHRHHTHGYLCALRGILDLYGATRDPSQLQFVRRCWDHVLAHQMWVTGGISEMSTNPFEDRDETCAVADWFRLSLRLWQETGEPRYVDVAEHALLNHLYFGQDHSGGFCQYRTLQDESTGVYRDSLAWYCCSMHGQRALLEAVMHICTCDENGIDINLFCESTARVPLEGRGLVAVKQTTSWPHEVCLEISPPFEMPFELRLRVPQWTASFQLRLNGSACDLEGRGGYVTLNRLWRPGDTVELRLVPTLRLVPEGASSFSLAERATGMGAAGQPINRAAVLYGPFVLMVDRVLDDHLLPCPRLEIALPLDGNGEPALNPSPEDLPQRGPFAVAGACFQTLGREATSRGRGRLLAGPWKRIHLVPVSEMTDREGRRTDLFATGSGLEEGRMTDLYKVRCDVWLLDEGRYRELLDSEARSPRAR